MNRAMESVFAEYQKEMLEEFDLFVLDGSYESGSYSEEKIVDRLSYYGAADMEQDVKRMEILTDNGGGPFLAQINLWAAHKYGLDKLGGFLGEAQRWKEQDEESQDVQREEERKNRSLETLLEQNDQQLPEEDNPLKSISALKSTPLLNLVMPKEKEISEKSVDLSTLLFHRTRESGHGGFQDAAGEKEAGALALGVYLLDHFESAVSGRTTGDSPAENVLEYELEYIIGGKESDRENLESVVQKILLIRMAPNYMYLQTDSQKKAEARAMALTLCALLAVPAVTEAVTQALIFAWAFGESVVDVRNLLQGGKVALAKDRESWQLQLSSLAQLGQEGEWNSGRDSDKGLDYQEYLRMLLFLQDTRQSAQRSLDLIEQRMKKEFGLEWFRADHCITKMEIESTCRLRRGISYCFSTYFGYN